uniref:Uncharacterized protein n=1 Tax=Anguilla anguilla TaxID=7936 RepID=A0A0E9PUB2_ANGAN
MNFSTQDDAPRISKIPVMVN